MHRRLFLSQLTIGLGFCLTPATLWAGSGADHTASVLSRTPLGEASQWIRSGELGMPQQVVLSHAYSPELTTLDQLLQLVQRDFNQLGQLLNTPIQIDLHQLVADAANEAFGSYRVRYNQDTLSIVWQGLARQGSPVRAPSGSMQIYGSQGMLQTDPTTGTYRIIRLAPASRMLMDEPDRGHFSATTSAGV